MHVSDLFSKDLRKCTGDGDFCVEIVESISHFKTIAPKKKGDLFSTVLIQSGGILPFYVIFCCSLAFYGSSGVFV